MVLQQAFFGYVEQHPGRHSDVQRTSLALRRGGVKTLEQLGDLYERLPQQLETMRDIGPRRMALIGEILRACGAQGPPGNSAE